VQRLDLSASGLASVDVIATFPSFQHVNNITRFSKALVTPAATAGLTLGECGRHGKKLPRISALVFDTPN